MEYDRKLIMDYNRFLNAVSLARKPSPIREMGDLLARSSLPIIPLHAGSPNADTYPFASAEFKLKDGSILAFDPTDMKTAFEPGPTLGQPAFRKQLRELQARVHNPPTLNKDDPNGGREICVTLGSQDAICKVLEMLVSRGDNVIVERPTYSPFLTALSPMGCNLLPVDTDHQGSIPSSLRQALSRWTPADAKDPNSGLPRIMYTVPNGTNPTGASLTLARKKEIYQIAREYNILILEDDPYYYLQFCEPRVPSFLSLDEDGRVIRFDSFSKVVAVALRVGFVTGPQPLVYRLMLHQMNSVMYTPCLNQMMISKLIETRGLDGFVEHTRNVRNFYKERRDAMMKCADRWLSGLAEWAEPTSGLFLWIKLKGIRDSKKQVVEQALEKQVALLPGCGFMPDPDAPCPYIRVSYSVVSTEDMDTALERLATLLKQAD